MTIKNRESLSHELKTRAAALEILEMVLDKKQNFDTAFDTGVSRYKGFDGRDRGFVRDLCLRLLRRKGQIDVVLSGLSNRGLGTIKPQSVLMILRIGAVQMLYMDVGDHAAVDTSVGLAQSQGYVQQKGFINAILRSIGRQKDALLKTADENLFKNTPAWLWKEWKKDYGLDVALEIINAHLTPAPVDITVKSDAKNWAEKLEGTLFNNGSIRLEKSGRIPELEGFDEGAWWVQSASASLPVQILGADLKGKTVIDLCAAPGGKTMQLAASGASVIAVDISKNRTARIHENLERCKLSADVIVADGKSWKPQQLADIVLIDAPCTATGTIRHQPDVLHMKAKADMDKLAKTQKDILNHASTMVKVGGTIIYCTCSLQKTESEAVVNHFLSNNNSFSRKPLVKDEVFGWSNMLTDQGDLRVLPHHQKENGGMDGFFIARLIRT